MRRSILLALALVMLAFVASACGDDDKKSSADNSTDHAFASEMVPHHEGAIEMAELARKRAEHAELKRLAAGIIRSQGDEIAILRPIGAELERADVPIGELGTQEHEMNRAESLTMLQQSDQFDRTFIEMMVPHHESAVQMAAVEVRSGKNPRLRKLADDIILAQRREIDQMKDWFVAWYGEELDTQGAGHSG